MPDILQDLPIAVSPSRVFEGVSQPALLDQWWTLRSTGASTVGSTYELDFGPNYVWHAVVTRSHPGKAFELCMATTDPDWNATVVGFEFFPSKTGTQVRFYHRGWPEANERYRLSAHCWALYLRVLRRHLELGETVAYNKRLSA
jgi:uncharacterized protein YndB with AHSA1/START domain